MDKPSSIGSTYAPDMVNKLSTYCELIGMDRTKLVSNLIVEALEGRILTNDFIDLDKPYYFDFKKLIHEGTVEATTKKPIIEAERIYILKKVPNNLDKPNKKYGTYSFSDDNPSYHKGLYFFTIISLLENVEDISLDSMEFLDFYFLFEYEQESGKIIIHSLEEDKLHYEVDFTVYSKAYKYIEEQEQEFLKTLTTQPNEQSFINCIDLFSDVMISYKLYKDSEYSIKLDKVPTIWNGYFEFKKFINK